MTSMLRLIRHFARLFFNPDIAVAGADPRGVWVVIAAVLAFPAVPLFLELAVAAGDPLPWLAFYMLLGMAVSGLMAAAAWDKLLPTRADFLILGALPMRTWAIAVAKLTALALALALVVAGVNAFSVVVLPILTVPDSAGMGVLLRAMGAQAAATAAGSLWVFLVILALQAAMLAAFGEDSLAERGLRLTVIFGLMLVLGLAPILSAPGAFASALRSRNPLLQPLRWFWAVHAILSGAAGVGSVTLAWRGVEALAAAGLAALMLGALATWRAASTAFARRPTHPAAPRLSAWLGRCLRAREERAVFRFGLATLARDRQHAVCLSAWLGLGAGLAAANFAWVILWAESAAQVGIALLAAPLILGFVLLMGLRQGFAIPVDLPANWIFQQSDNASANARLQAAWAMLAFCGVVPVASIAFCLAGWCVGARAGIEAATVTVLLLLLLVEVLLLGFDKVPYTCSHVSGRANFKYAWPLYCAGFAVFSFTSSSWEFRLRTRPGANLIVAVVVAGLVLGLSRRRRRCWQALGHCRYTERLNPVVEPFMTSGTDF